MKKLAISAIFAIFAFAQISFAQTRITAAELESMMKNDKTTQLVDVRTGGELKQTGIIEGARHINFYDPGFQAEAGKLDKNKPVVLYCAVGGRSASAASSLVRMGFKKVYDYGGGMTDWKAKSKKTVPYNR